MNQNEDPSSLKEYHEPTPTFVWYGQQLSFVGIKRSESSELEPEIGDRVRTQAETDFNNWRSVNKVKTFQEFSTADKHVPLKDSYIDFMTQKQLHFYEKDDNLPSTDAHSKLWKSPYVDDNMTKVRPRPESSRSMLRKATVALVVEIDHWLATKGDQENTEEAGGDSEYDTANESPLDSDSSDSSGYETADEDINENRA